MSDHNISDNGNTSTDIFSIRPRVPVIRILYFFYFASFGVVVTFLNVYYRDMGLSGVQIGLLSSITPLIAIVAAPMWGGLSDRIGQVRRLLLIACLGIMFAAGGISQSNVFFWIVFFTVLFAFFDSSILTILDSTTLRMLGLDRDSFGRERVWGSVGFVLVVWGVGFFLQRYGSQWLFLFFILMVGSMVVSLGFLPKQRTKYNATVFSNIKKLILQKKWILFSASLILLGLGNTAINGFLGIYIKDLGGDEGLVGTAAALATITELPVLFWGNKLLKRFGPWRLLVAAYGTTVVRLLLYSVMPTAVWVVPISLLHSLTFGVYWIATVSYVDTLAGDEIKSSAQGMLYAVLSISRMFSSLVVGFLYDEVGAGNLFFISAFFTLFAIMLLIFIRPKEDNKIRYGGV